MLIDCKLNFKNQDYLPKMPGIVLPLLMLSYVLKTLVIGYEQKPV